MKDQRILLIIISFLLIYYSLSQSIPSFSCPYYSVTNTNSDTQNYSTCTYTMIGYQARVTGSNNIILNILILI